MKVLSLFKCTSSNIQMYFKQYSKNYLDAKGEIKDE